MNGPVGICLRPEYDDYSLDRMGDYAKIAEERGFHSLWVAESWGLDAFALLTHFGGLTSRIKLGTAIVNVFSRTPALLAMSSVTVNDLYAGRFTLGLGASTKALIEKFHGLKFEHPATRLRETVEIVREAMAGREVRYNGKTAMMDGYRLRVSPRAAPPPIYLAALGPESMKVVAKVADGWLPYLLPLSGIASTAAKLREACLKAGRPENAVAIAPLVVTAVSHDADEAREAARKHIGFYLGAMGPHYRGFVASFGFEQEVERIRLAWAAKDVAGAEACVTDEMVRELCIAGTPDEARAQLDAIRAAGADLPILFFPGACTNAMVELALETMAERAGVAA